MSTFYIDGVLFPDGAPLLIDGVQAQFVEAYKPSTGQRKVVWQYVKELTLPQYSASFNLASFINANRGTYTNIVVTNSRVQPSMYSGNLAGLTVKFINNGELRGTAPGNHALILSSDLIVINNGWIRGAGGNGGKGANGVKGANVDVIGPVQFDLNKKTYGWTTGIESGSYWVYKKAFGLHAWSNGNKDTQLQLNYEPPVAEISGFHSFIEYNGKKYLKGALISTGPGSHNSTIEWYKFHEMIGTIGGKGGEGGKGGIGASFTHAQTSGQPGKPGLPSIPAGGASGTPGATGGYGGNWGANGGKGGTVAGNAITGSGFLISGSKTGNVNGKII